MATREQERARTAYARVSPRVHNPRAENLRVEKEKEADYLRFAKSFPALIQSCGLAQAVSFAEAKAPTGYLDDLATVMDSSSSTELALRARDSVVTEYQRYSREALAAATWVKRYAEALLKGDD